MSILVIVGIIFAAIFLAPIAIGFGSTGVRGGSIASGLQSGVGNVVAGSLFAIVQSFAMGGIFTKIAIIAVIVTVIGYLS